MEATSQRTISALSWLAIVLVVIGALNWGLVGLANFNLVAAIFGAGSALSRIVYILVAIAGIYLIGASPRFRRPVRPA
jgi:uncharacterized membrane protein YuzA (DUF378 family)